MAELPPGDGTFLSEFPISGNPSLEIYRQALLPKSQEVREATQKILELNLQNMVSADGQLHKKAVQTRNAMLFLLFIGTAGAMGFIVLVIPSILEPIASLTRSVREIQKGNLDLIVNVSFERRNRPTVASV